MEGDIVIFPFWETTCLSPLGKDIVKVLHFWRFWKKEIFPLRCSDTPESTIQYRFKKLLLRTEFAIPESLYLGKGLGLYFSEYRGNPWGPIGFSESSVFFLPLPHADQADQSSSVVTQLVEPCGLFVSAVGVTIGLAFFVKEVPLDVGYPCWIISGVDLFATFVVKGLSWSGRSLLCI